MNEPNTTNAISPNDVPARIAALDKPHPLPSEEILSEEEKYIVAGNKKYLLTPRYNRWLEYYTDPKSETRDNATRSAVRAYPGVSIGTAQQYGFDNARKTKIIAHVLGEQKGHTLSKMLDVAWLNMMKGNIGYWDRLMDLYGFKSQMPEVLVQNNIQNNTTINVSEEDKKSFNEQFVEWVRDSK